MAQAYSPGLLVSMRTRIRKTRELPLPGEVLVKMGDRVEPDTPVLCASHPGEIEIVRIADQLGIEPEDVGTSLNVAAGSEVAKGQLLCERKSFFGLFTSSVSSPCQGVVEYYSAEIAHLGIRHPPSTISVNAHLQGKVVEVEDGKSVTIEAEGALVQGIFGVGGERRGKIIFLDKVGDIEPEDLRESELKGSILIGGRSFTNAALKRAGELEVSGVVTGSIDSVRLGEFVGREIGVSVTGDENVPFTLIVTEGFGSLEMSKRVKEVFRVCSGKLASVSGATQVRAGAMRPEVLIPGVGEGSAMETREFLLEVGRMIRCVRVPFFGRLGKIVGLPHEAVEMESGARVRAAKVKFEDGDRGEVMVPRANIEIVG